MAMELISSGSLVLTVNRRLSQEIRSLFNQRQLDSGQLVWESAHTSSWSDWIEAQFQELIDHGQIDLTLLSPHQTRILWENIIKRSDQEYGVLNPSGAARTAYEAWALTQAWDIPTDQLTGYHHSETDLFLSWAEKFSYRCGREGWIDVSMLPQLLGGHLEGGFLSVPDRIILAGFDQITPQQQNVLAILQGQGCEISSLGPDHTLTSAHRYQAQDRTQEIHTAVRWAIRRLQGRTNARVGIVVPQLAQLRAEIERTLDHCLDPSSILPGATRSEPTYNISLGIPLTQCPLVIDAFLILRLMGGELPSGDLSRLLRSCFIAGGRTERGRRARLDASIRQDVGEREIGLSTVIQEVRRANESEDDACPILLNILKSFRTRLNQIPARQSPQRWTETFLEMLYIFGWCRADGMDAIEYQQVERFNKALGYFQQLGQIEHTMDMQEAIGHLHAIMTDTTFQARGSEAQIQVVGVLEAAGLVFDHLWVLGMSDDCWPPRPAPNPLLPIALQRRLGLPHSSPQRELEYARDITARLLASAPEVIVSHVLSDGDKELRVSPLLAHLPPMSMDDLDLAAVPDIHRIGFSSTELQEMTDNRGPALDYASHMSGGSGLLADQSACPFRAFARHRLGARPLEDPTSGLDRRSRGNIIHHILQLVWERIREHGRLVGMDDLELEGLVAEQAGKALSRESRKRPKTFVPRFVEIEQERLTTLVLEWLRLEMDRMPFRVAMLEQRERVNLAGLEIDVRADRIDQLEDGTRVIIDYKTGRTLSINGWFEPRIEEPQLPLYATIADEEISAVCLASVNPTRMGFSGIAAQEGELPGVKAISQVKEAGEFAGWDGLKAAWRQRLEVLAHEVMEGRAEVMPKDANKDCLYCPLPSLCRIHEWVDKA